MPPRSPEVERLRAVYAASAAALYEAGLDLASDALTAPAVEEMVLSGAVYDPARPHLFVGQAACGGAVECDAAAVPAWASAGRRRGKSGDSGLLAAVTANWSRRASVPPFTRVAVTVGERRHGGIVLGVRMRRGVRVYEVRLGPTRVVSVPEFRVERSE
jgi:hypothetical protein